MRGHVIASVVVLAGCGRVGFDDARTSGDGGTDAARAIDANVCLSSTADVPSWPMPNDPLSIGLPNIASRTPMVGRIVDNITGLEWQRDIAPGEYSWDAAVSYCSSLQLDGGCWRLPERIELASIVDYSIYSPSIASMFPDTPIAEFWTNTTFAHDTSHRWSVRFDVGYLLDRDATSTGRVRCVRGAQSATQRYSIAAETVRDLQTGLEWQRTVGPSHMWADAHDYCTTLVLDGGNWRSPSIQEMETLVDTTRMNMATIDPIAFPSTPQTLFWSGSEIQNDASQGWTIDFSAGFSFRPITTLLPTRCVR